MHCVVNGGNVNGNANRGVNSGRVNACLAEVILNVEMARVTAMMMTKMCNNVRANYHNGDDTGVNTILQTNNNNNNLRMPGHDICKMSQMRACTRTSKLHQQKTIRAPMRARPCACHHVHMCTPTHMA